MPNPLGKLFKFHLLFALLLLTSCAMFKKQDGPPTYRVDASRIHNAVPKKEPLSKYGNMRSYCVFGKCYNTLKSSVSYDRIGMASWYGTKFHNRHTSSGEPYNMLAMTAAHKTLPLPTYVEVTNLRNHRSVIVKVNDRGPFESNRLIDLSYVAAIKLGMIGHGTARVRVKAINPITNHRIFLEVGTFHNKGYAVKLKEKIQSHFHIPVSIARFSPKSYLLRLGPITSVSVAHSLHRQLQNLDRISHPTIRIIS